VKHVLLFATRNQGKVREFRELFASLQSIEIRTLDEVPPVPEVVEDADTFTGNAIKKAVETARASGLMTLSDDSGLEVDSLDGGPGVHSARFAGVQGDDAANNEKLIRLLKDVPFQHRTARYRVVLAFADVTGDLAVRPHTEQGVCEGRIRLEPAGRGGFGYDPYFEPQGFSRTMAELGADEKNRISHRGFASRRMRDFLTKYLATRAS
jgi:XTP/dITP diphosphohydrolase